MSDPRYYVSKLPLGSGEGNGDGTANYWVVRDRESGGTRIPGPAEPTRAAAKMLADEMNANANPDAGRNWRDRLFDYEDGKLDEDQTIELFQHLVDSGLAWKLQGSYGRTAARMINAGLITTKGEE